MRKTTQTRPNTFPKPDGKNAFDRWHARRGSDGRWRYKNAAGTETKWLTVAEAKVAPYDTWVRYTYSNGGTLSATVSEGDYVVFVAQWK